MVTEQNSRVKLLPFAAFVLVTAGSIGTAMADPQMVEPAPAPAPAAATGQTPPDPSVTVATAQPAAQPVPPPPMAPQAPAGPMPRAHHAAIHSALPAEPLSIKVRFDNPQLIRRAVVIVASPASKGPRVVVFQRGGNDEYVAVIPEDAIQAPGFAYAIEIEHVNGSRIAAFASRSAMHPVTVIEDRADARERAALARLGGRRSTISASGEYVGFGYTSGSTQIPCGNSQPDCVPGVLITPSVYEQFYRIEANYTYRSLRTVSEFGFRLGVLRGRSFKTIDTFEEDKYEVGLNFGAARVRFRLLDAWQVEAELVTSITEQGFSAGLGGSTLIGDPYGTKIILGFETLGLGGVNFGSRFYSRMDIVGGSRLLVSPIIEVTDMPNANAYGVRLLGEVGIKVAGGFSIQLRGGYQARRSTSGGPGFGGSLLYSF